MLFRSAAMWMAGVMQGLMWRAVNPDGTLMYSFVESVKATYPFYMIRFFGGALYLSGMGVMVWNTYKTAQAGRYVPVRIPTSPNSPTTAHGVVPSPA